MNTETREIRPAPTLDCPTGHDVVIRQRVFDNPPRYSAWSHWGWFESYEKAVEAHDAALKKDKETWNKPK